MSLSSSSSASSDNTKPIVNDKPHHRQKRLFWITNDGRIALPPGTSMTITPTLTLPFVRHPPNGFHANMSISLPFTIYFDQLGLTDEENPYGALPPIFDRAMKGRSAGLMLSDFVASFIKKKFQKRDINDAPTNAFHGGERALLYGTTEDMISTLGLDGKACLLRAICEVQSHPLNNFGFIGEILKLFFTASKSPYSKLLNDYVEAEKRGKEHGECWPYFKNCPKSLFLPSNNKYTETANDDLNNNEFEDESHDDDDDDDKIDLPNQQHMMNPTM